MKHAVKIELDTKFGSERIVTFNVSMPAEKIGFIRNFLNYHGHVVTTGRDVEGHPSFNTTMKTDEILSLYYKIDVALSQACRKTFPFAILSRRTG